MSSSKTLLSQASKPPKLQNDLKKQKEFKRLLICLEMNIGQLLWGGV
jgi:hypothetical protein